MDAWRHYSCDKTGDLQVGENKYKYDPGAGGVDMYAPPSGFNFFHFMQCTEKNCQIIGWHP